MLPQALARMPQYESEQWPLLAIISVSKPIKLIANVQLEFSFITVGFWPQHNLLQYRTFSSYKDRHQEIQTQISDISLSLYAFLLRIILIGFFYLISALYPRVNPSPLSLTLFIFVIL